MMKSIGDFVEKYLRMFIIFITNYLPVKVIRDDDGVPFLYRYYIFSFGNNGSGIVIHRFVKSDPGRGYHDHPWKNGVSFIVSGEYEERILVNKNTTDYTTHIRKRFQFNHVDGIKTFHRVMIEEGKDAWTIFAFQKRSKTWNMVSLRGKSTAMSTTVQDTDGGWWNTVGKGKSIHSHIPLQGKVIATVDIVVIANNSKVLLIKRGKTPFVGEWAFPGGRIEQKDKDIMTAAKRELREETNLDGITLKYYKTIGNNTRDPRGFSLTNVFTCTMMTTPGNVKAGDDAVDYKWFDLKKLPKMAFDHGEIINDVQKNMYT